jgi:hypothetical protein
MRNVTENSDQTGKELFISNYLDSNKIQSEQKQLNLFT